MIMRQYQQEDTDTETQTDLSPQAPNKVIILLWEENEACFSEKEPGQRWPKLISRFTNNEECPFWPLFL